jgi:hypothetical protein
MLIKLLQRDGDGPVDIPNFTESERNFMRTTCAHTVVLYTICFMADFDEARAKEGFASLAVNTDKMIEEICSLRK